MKKNFLTFITLLLITTGSVLSISKKKDAVSLIAKSEAKEIPPTQQPYAQICLDGVSIEIRCGVGAATCQAISCPTN